MITRKPLFYWILNRNRLFQLLLFLIIMAGVLFRVVPLEMQKRIVNTAIELKQTDLLFLYCGVYIGAVILSGLLKYAANVLQKYLGQKILKEIRTDLYTHILRLPLGFFRRTAPGTVITAMTSELNAVGHFIGGALAVPLTSALTLITFAGYMIYLNPTLGLISVALYPFELILIPMLQNRYNRLNARRIGEIRSMSNIISEAISGIHEIQGNAAYRLELRKISRFIREIFFLMNRLYRYKYGIKFVNNLFQNFGPFLLFLVGGYLAIHGQFSLGALVAFLSAYEKVYDPWKELIEYYQEYQDARIRYQRVMSCFDLEPEFEIMPEGRPPLRLDGRIAVEHLSYTVEGQIHLLNDISLSLSPGEQMALVGFSGSGKSTLAMLLGQQYRYQRGNIRIDDQELKLLTRQDVSQSIGFVAQHPFIFNGTIRDNLLYGCHSLRLYEEDAPSCDFPDPAPLLDMVRQVGLGDDVIRFGLNRMIPPEQHRKLVEKVFDMRLTVHRKLARSHPELVEFYDVDRYMRQISVYKNLLFGDIRDPAWQLAALPENRQFIRLIRELDLHEPLLALGSRLARETVHLLQDLQDDDFFFEGSPLQPEEFDIYREIVHRIDTGTDLSDRTLARRLLVLALRYVPARHKMAGMPAELQKGILEFRRRFLSGIARVDLAFCRQFSEKFREGIDPGLPLPAEPDNPDFSLYCPMDYLCSRTLLENIVFGTPCTEEMVDMDELRGIVVEHLEGKGLLDEVMEAGLDFEVGSKGDRLSGGQRQKIAIARALLKETPVLILDEATASLDNASQNRIQQYIGTKLRGKRTVIAVVHRLDMVPGYDKIVVMKNGRIAEAGVYDELMEKRGVFYELVRGNG